MKRTDLVSDEKKRDQAKTVAGSRSNSESVDFALEEYIQRQGIALRSSV